jgi:hypothetical protein
VPEVRSDFTYAGGTLAMMTEDDDMDAGADVRTTYSWEDTRLVREDRDDGADGTFDSAVTYVYTADLRSEADYDTDRDGAPDAVEHYTDDPRGRLVRTELDAGADTTIDRIEHQRWEHHRWDGNPTGSATRSRPVGSVPVSRTEASSAVASDTMRRPRAAITTPASVSVAPWVPRCSNGTPVRASSSSSRRRSVDRGSPRLSAAASSDPVSATARKARSSSRSRTSPCWNRRMWGDPSVPIGGACVQRVGEACLPDLQLADEADEPPRAAEGIRQGPAEQRPLRLATDHGRGEVHLLRR